MNERTGGSLQAREGFWHLQLSQPKNWSGRTLRYIRLRGRSSFEQVSHRCDTSSEMIMLIESNYLVLEDPTTNQMFLSGISHGSSLNPWELPIPRDPHRAFIKNLARRENRWNADFHMANLFEQDKDRKAGKRI
jgi:hypothetical protein